MLTQATVTLTDLQRRLQEELGLHEHLGKMSITPTYLEGGSIEQLNVIPADAILGIDIRTTPAIDHPTLLAEVNRILDESSAATGVTLELTIIDDRPSADTPLDSKVVQALVVGHEKVTGEPARVRRRSWHH